MADARAPNLASVGGTSCGAHGGTSLASRWRIVRADKTPSRGAAANLSRARAWTSFLLFSLSLFQLEVPPPFAGSFSLSFPFSAPRSRLLPLFVTPGPLRAVPNCFNLPRRESKHEPRPSFRTVRARKCGRMEVPESVGGEIEDGCDSIW